MPYDLAGVGAAPRCPRLLQLHQAITLLGFIANNNIANHRARHQHLIFVPPKRAAAMLPHDSMVASNVSGSHSGSARVAGVARLAQNSAGCRPTGRVQTGLQGYGLASQSFLVPSASGPRAIPSLAQRGAAAVLEAPTQTSQHTSWVDLGYPRNIEDKYEFGKELGKGGNGVVREVTSKESAEVFACKAIAKELTGDVSDKKKAGHIDSIRRELEVLRRLSGSLNVVRLIDVYEDEQNVYVVQELCKGGELWHRIGERHYSERTVASYMRAVLRTLAQCHSHRILHRDVKPGNFMLLDESERSPLKAIDFGLAVPFESADLPLTDLGLEGTPWYMAPEVLSSQVTPASDVWAAGVMAHQLLSGRLPFDDHRNPFAPSISAVWRSVLTDRVDYNMPWWKGISDDGKDFVHMLLNRDPTKRPSAKEALKHPWLQGNSTERSIGKQIDVSVVARIQRFAQNNRFKRSVLRLIAEELLSRPGALAAETALQAEAAVVAAAAADRSGSGRDVRYDPDTGNPIIKDPNSRAMQDIFRKLELTGDAVDRESAALALSKLGYRLEPCEITRLLEQVDTSNSGKVKRAALAASQIDWRHLQQNHMDTWLDIARGAFAALDHNGDGLLHVGDIMSSLKAKLPHDELRHTIQQAMQEAGHGEDAEAMDFDGFLRMLRVGSVDSLDQYDARWDRTGSFGSSLDRLQSLLDSSQHGSDNDSTHGRSSRGLYAGLAQPTPSAAAAASAHGGGVTSAAADAYRDKTWQKPMVNFKFDFGSEFRAHKMGAGALANQGPPRTRGAPDADAAAAEAAAAVPEPKPASNAVSASSYFNNGAVRGGTHFDKRMHGGSLYRNAVVGGGRPNQLHAAHALPTVRE